ncbi:hypothetical protein TNCV_2643121 [Trichonephila clavipes]|nr:hypothetical protein TNCV_2643121 [Trichonephila clavipes]
MMSARAKRRIFRNLKENRMVTLQQIFIKERQQESPSAANKIKQIKTVGAEIYWATVRWKRSNVFFA